MQETEQLAHDWFEKFWNGRSPEVARHYADETSRFHTVDVEGGALHGVSNFLKFYDGLLSVFPDIRFQIEQVVASGDMAAVRWTARATHKGPWMGRAPTGKTVSVSGIGIVRVKDGKVTEAWDEWDRHGILAQIDR